MKSKDILISIVMLILNVEEKIKLALESIRNQNIDPEKIKIDGRIKIGHTEWRFQL